MGAQAVLVGRAYAYGLGAAGHAGVVRALEILRADLERVLRLMGCASVADLNPSLVGCTGSVARKPTRAVTPVFGSCSGALQSLCKDS